MRHSPLFPHVMLAELARSHPTAPAVLFANATYNFTALQEHATKLVAYFYNCGVREGNRVAVYLPRGLDAIATIIALWRLGAVYVPLDPDRGREDDPLRISHIAAVIQATEVTHCVCVPGQSGLRSHSAEIASALERVVSASPPVLLQLNMSVGYGFLFEAVEAAPSLDREAYCISSSGSTGAPKVIPISFHGLSYWAATVFPALFAAPAVPGPVLGYASSEFDPSIWELLMALFNKQPLCIVSEDHYRNIEKLAEFIERHKVSDITLVPSVIAALLPYLSRLIQSGLHRIYTTGEKCPQKIAQAVSDCAAAAKRTFDAAKAAGQVVGEPPDLRLVNCYGPTEMTFGVSMGPLKPEDFVEGMPLISQPMLPVRMFVVEQLSDHSFKTVAPGKQGVILGVGGANVTRGYLGAPPVDMARVHPRVTVDGVEYDGAYFTDDRATVTPDGKVHFAGREGNFEKTNGVFVNLEAVEAALKSYKGVKNACAVVHRTDHSSLVVACLEMEAGESTPRESELYSFLKSTSTSLPAEAMPQLTLPLANIPLASSGKTDRRRVKQLVAELVQARESQLYHPPRTMLEEQLVRLWDWIFFKEDQCRTALTSPGVGSEVVKRQLNILRREWVFEEKSSELWDRISLPESAEIIRIGIHTSFVEVGGDSLRSSVLLQALQALYGLPKNMLSINDLGLFHRLTIQDLSGTLFLALMEVHNSKPLMRDARPAGVLLLSDPVSASTNDLAPVFVLPDITGGVYWARTLIDADKSRVYYGIPLPGLTNPILSCLDLDALATYFSSLIEAANTNGHPIHILAYSLGATFLHAVAAKLKGQVGFLGIVDGALPQATNGKKPFAHDLVRLLAHVKAPWKVGEEALSEDFATKPEEQDRVLGLLQKLNPGAQVDSVRLVGSDEISPAARMVSELLHLVANTELPMVEGFCPHLYVASDSSARMEKLGGYSDPHLTRSLGWGLIYRGAVSIFEVVGADHFSILTGQWLAKLLSAIRTNLQATEVIAAKARIGAAERVVVNSADFYAFLEDKHAAMNAELRQVNTVLAMLAAGRVLGAGAGASALIDAGGGIATGAGGSTFASVASPSSGSVMPGHSATPMRIMARGRGQASADSSAANTRLTGSGKVLVGRLNNSFGSAEALSPPKTHFPSWLNWVPGHTGAATVIKNAMAADVGRGSAARLASSSGSAAPEAGGSAPVPPASLTSHPADGRAGTTGALMRVFGLSVGRGPIAHANLGAGAAAATTNAGSTGMVVPANEAYSPANGGAGKAPPMDELAYIGAGRPDEGAAADNSLMAGWAPRTALPRLTLSARRGATIDVTAPVPPVAPSVSSSAALASPRSVSRAPLPPLGAAAIARNLSGGSSVASRVKRHSPTTRDSSEESDEQRLDSSKGPGSHSTAASGAFGGGATLRQSPI